MYIMTEPYTETILVTCDRQSAKTKSNDGLNSTWTNDFNNTIQLNPGDRVSVYNSFVSERGSATPDSVEFKGVKLDKQKTLKYTTISDTSFFKTAGDDFKDIVYRQQLSTNEEKLDLHDNKASIVINYYKNMDCLSYYHLPRRFIYVDGLANRFFRRDSVVSGRTNTEPAPTSYLDVGGNTNFFYNHQKWGLVQDDYFGELETLDNTQTIFREGRVHQWKLKNDNSRYTIMCRTNTILEVPENLPADWDDNFPPPHAKDPEYFDYKILREKIDLEVDPGFSSSNYVAEEVSRQLQQSEELPDETYIASWESTNGNDVAVIRQKTSKTYKSKTYKPFNSSNDYYQTRDKYDKSISNFNPPALPGAPIGTSGPALVIGVFTPDGFIYESDNTTNAEEIVDYYRTYQYIGVKRPEIYEAGSELNDIFGLGGGITTSRPEGDIDLDYSKSFGIPIYNLTYNKENLLKLKKFIDTQGLYPELFSEDNIRFMIRDRPAGSQGASDNVYMSANNNPYININNARYLHINSQEIKKYNNLIGDDYRNAFYDAQFGKVTFTNLIQLGNSGYDWRGIDPTDNTQYSREDTDRLVSNPFFFKYDPDYKDTYFERPYGSDLGGNFANWTPFDITKTPKPKLTYGCFGVDPTTNFIMIFPCMLQGALTNLSDGTPTRNIGLPPRTFTHTNTSGELVFEEFNKIGFDRHFNAWGNAVINLTTGIPQDSFVNPYPNTQNHAPANFNGTLTQYGMTIPDVATSESGATPLSKYQYQTANNRESGNIQKYLAKQYLGADNPRLVFDGNHFVFDGLHTPLNKGNLNDTDDPPDGRESDVVYKINPSQKYDNWSPVQYPYEEAVRMDYIHKDQAADKQSQVYIRMNRNLEENTIYDGTTGIFIEDFGFDEDSWEDGFWGRLGFSYTQFNSGVEKSDRNTRISSVIEKTNILTTNAEVDMRDTKGWNQNKFGNPRYDGKILHSYQFFAYHMSDQKNIDGYLKYIPEIVEGQVGVQIVADDYPVQLNNGYYGIRSDIISNSINALGDGNVSYPLVSISDKINSVKDFYISSPSSVQHTITKPTIISSITTKITDPDGSLARCSPRSVVIYKIEKERIIKDLLTEMRMKFEKEEMDKK